MGRGGEGEMRIGDDANIGDFISDIRCLARKSHIGDCSSKACPPTLLFSQSPVDANKSGKHKTGAELDAKDC